MILKGLYTTAIDRLPEDNYIKYMRDRFSIFISEDARRGKYIGFIKKNPSYDIKIPFIYDGKIGSFLDHDMRTYHASGICEVKRVIKHLIKDDPERFIQLAEITRVMNEEYQNRRRKAHHLEYYERKS